jgi:hypothetical protein
MSLADIRKKTKLKPPKLVLYGGAGIGKTSFASGMNAPIFALTEDGMGKIQCDHFPVAKDYDTFIANLKTLLDEDHEYKTLAVDSLDWLEPLIWEKVCQEHGKKSIEEFGYGRGYVEALKQWREYIDILNRLRDEKSMTIIQIAHNQIKRFESPEIEAYDRHELKLHRKAGDLILEHSDCCFFANFKLGTVKTQGKGGQTNTKAVQGDRVIYTQAKPAFLAKNRYGLPEEMPFDWESIREAIIKN